MTRILSLVIAALLFTAFGGTAVHAENAGAGQADTGNQQIVAYWLDRGAMALQAGEPEKARMAFERALLLDPRQALTHANLGRAHLAADHVSAAYKYLRTALDIDPQNLDALHWAGLVDLRRDNVDVAKQKRDKLLTLCSSNCAQYKSLSEAIGAYADKKVAEETAALSVGNKKTGK